MSLEQSKSQKEVQQRLQTETKSKQQAEQQLKTLADRVSQLEQALAQAENQRAEAQEYLKAETQKRTTADEKTHRLSEELIKAIATALNSFLFNLFSSLYSIFFLYTLLPFLRL